ncbi:hypothetical protein BGW39_011337 [Mortierella sp. 14UC]|nr:hypothetical protein BGW39_011337 [Mortierella sp. 14UC]
MPPSSVIDGPVSGYVFQWCASRNSMLLHGGTNMNLLGDARPREYTNPYLIEYNPREHTWTPYNGTKMVVFGGESLQGSQSVEGGPRGAIYILDVPSLTWKRGPDVDPIHNRSAMACAAAGDSFVAWGGKSKTDTLNSTIIFNIDDSVWTDKFRQRQASKGNGAIIGGAAAAALSFTIAG